MDFKPYYNNWLDVSELFRPSNVIRKNDILKVDLDTDFFDFYNKVPYKTLIQEAAIEANKVLGNKPALCFSGGVDSQVMLNCWLEANLKFDLFILVFNNDLNKQDVDHARRFCNSLGVTLNEIQIDIIKFLNFFNFEYAVKYNCCSPHFNTHFKLFNILKERGYTGVCTGGDAPLTNLYNNHWGGNYTRNTQTFTNYSIVENFPCIGNFIGYYPKLAWSIALNTKPFYLPTLEGQIVSNSSLVVIDQNEQVVSKVDNLYKDNIDQRYIDKCFGYEKLGFNILRQEQKFTGFENVKTYLEQQSGDGWEFEKRYRQPLENYFNYSYADPIFKFKDGVENIINSIHSNNFASAL
jgi:hypothetical protein